MCVVVGVRCLMWSAWSVMVVGLGLWRVLRGVWFVLLCCWCIGYVVCSGCKLCVVVVDCGVCCMCGVCGGYGRCDGCYASILMNRYMYALYISNTKFDSS